MRLGAYECEVEPDTRAAAAYGERHVVERHRHRYEFNQKYERAFRDAGAVFSGRWPEKRLVEILELPSHPWFVSCQFHPEFRSRPGAPHPLFSGFVRAALRYSGAGGDENGADSADAEQDAPAENPGRVPA
jgi:CTP synthase